MKKLHICLCIWLLSVPVLLSQPVHPDLPQITGCVALVHARVVTAPGKSPVVANVITRNGLITHVGSNGTIPNDAYRIAADSFYVYPAFIDAFSNTGIKEQKEEQAQGGPPGPGNRSQRAPVDEDGNPSLEDAGITPFISTRTTFDPKSKLIEDWRNQGFAIAHVVPKGKMIPGKGAIVILSGKSADEAIWKEDISLFSQWSGAGGNYPNTIIGMMAKWRELYYNAEHSMAHLAMYSGAPMVSRPQYNRAHQAFIPVIKKEIPVYFRAPKIKDIYRALDLKKQLGMNMVIADAQQAWSLKEYFQQPHLHLVLSLDLPEDKKEKKTPETKADTTAVTDSTSQVSTDTVKVDPEKAAFEKRRAESYKEHLEQAGYLAKAGIPFSFSTMSGKSGDFSKTMQTLLKNGLDRDQALHALTVAPSKLLGIDQYCGTIEAGKMANLIVATKPLFEEGSMIRYMLVEGTLFDIEAKEKKKSESATNPSTAGMLGGTWSYVINIPDQQREGTLTFSVQSGEVTGKITLQEYSGGVITLRSIVVNKNSVSFSFPYTIEGQNIEVEYDIEISGESFDGSVTAGSYGSFPVTGDRIEKPN
ncbi:MAG TPA: amidohydrolase family protein [Saprospiraceae bacterium]|nr:amidohydrolase family protein [Saprospiraceae bacterium]